MSPIKDLSSRDCGDLIDQEDKNRRKRRELWIIEGAVTSWPDECDDSGSVEEPEKTVMGFWSVTKEWKGYPAEMA